MSTPQDLSVHLPHIPVFDLLTKCVYVFRISCKDLKNMLSQVNYRVPNMRFLREKLPVTFFSSEQTSPISYSLGHFLYTVVLVKACDCLITTPPPSCPSQDSELRNGDVSFSQFAQLYRSLMFDAQKNVSLEIGQLQRFHPPSPTLMHPRATFPLLSVCSQMTA